MTKRELSLKPQRFKAQPRARGKDRIKARPLPPRSRAPQIDYSPRGVHVARALQYSMHITHTHTCTCTLRKAAEELAWPGKIDRARGRAVSASFAFSSRALIDTTWGTTAPRAAKIARKGGFTPRFFYIRPSALAGCLTTSRKRWNPRGCSKRSGVRGAAGSFHYRWRLSVSFARSERSERTFREKPLARIGKLLARARADCARERCGCCRFTGNLERWVHAVSIIFRGVSSSCNYLLLTCAAIWGDWFVLEIWRRSIFCDLCQSEIGRRKQTRLWLIIIKN